LREGEGGGYPRPALVRFFLNRSGPEDDSAILRTFIFRGGSAEPLEGKISIAVLPCLGAPFDIYI